MMRSLATVREVRGRLLRRVVLPLSRGSTQVGPTPSVVFRAVVGSDGNVEMEVAL
jgi:hypothetical protein